MAGLMISLMQQVKFTPPADVPAVEQDSSSESVTSESDEASDPEPPRVPSVSPEPTTAHSTLKQSSAPLHSKSKRTFIPEIPSPWDEDIAGQSATSTPEELEPPTIDTPKAVPNC